MLMRRVSRRVLGISLNFHHGLDGRTLHTPPLCAPKSLFLSTYGSLGATMALPGRTARPPLATAIPLATVIERRCDRPVRSKCPPLVIEVLTCHLFPTRSGSHGLLGAIEGVRASTGPSPSTDADVRTHSPSRPRLRAQQGRT